MKAKNLFLFVFLSMMIFAYIIIFLSTIRLKVNLLTVSREIESLKAENRILTQEYLKLTNPSYIEKIAKEKLHFVEVKNFYVVEIEGK